MSQLSLPHSLLLKDYKLGHLTSTTWCLATPLTWLFLFLFNLVKPLKSPSVYLFVKLPYNFPSWHSRELPVPHIPVGPRDLQNSHWEKNISLFLPWNLAVILKLVSYSEVIEQSGCSLYSSMKLLPRVILSAVLQVSQSYILFKRLKKVLHLCETDF